MTKLFLSVFVTWGLANVLKPVITLFREKRIGWDTIFTSGGMPSGHTSLVASSAVALYLETGLSPYFLTALVLAFIVIYDALQVRTVIGRQARILNRLLAERGEGERLEENVGHTLAEVAVSLALSFMIPILVYSVF